MNAILFNLANLARFSGREKKAVFWPYAGLVIAVTFVATFAIMIPSFVETFQRMQEFASAHPDQATVTQGPGSYSIRIEGNHPELFPDISAFMGGMTVIAAIVVVLLAAAVTRRLHDRGRRGFWGILPLPFLATGFALMPKLFGSEEPDMHLFGYLFLNNAIYLGSLILLIIMLAGDSTPGENRYGPPPE